ncbi:MAG: aquaporin [Vulcanimicrobiaceae bacterium]
MPSKEPAEPQRPAPSEGQRIGAEFVGTFLLTLVAAGADILDHVTPAQTIGHVARYLAPALMVMALIYSLSPISGAHLNPVVTLAFLARRCFPLRRVPGYVAAQLLAAVAAALLLQLLFGGAVEHGVTKPAMGFTNVQAVVLEAILSFILVYTILATSEEEATVGKNAALAVAGVIALCGLAFSPVSGSSMNPARSFGPQLVAGEFSLMWIYFVGPIAGSLLAVLLVEFIHGPPNKGEFDAGRGKHAHA